MATAYFYPLNVVITFHMEALNKSFKFWQRQVLAFNPAYSTLWILRME